MCVAELAMVLPASMLLYSLAMLQVFWCAVCGQATCSNATVCIAGETDFGGDECRQLGVSHTFHSLSDIPLEARSCKIIHIYLTSGTHILSESLDFTDSVEETEIYGQSSTIVCLNRTGIRFSENTTVNIVLLSGIMLLHCHRNYGNSIQAALYFKYASYNLINMAIMSTEGYGLYASQCTEQFIFDTIFNNNSMGSTIQNRPPQTFVPIRFKNVTFDHGRTAGGIRVIRVNCNLSIVDCKFQGGIYIHILMKDNSAVTEIMIKRSIFIGSSSTAVAIQFKGESSKMVIAVHNCFFMNGKGHGLLINNSLYVEITGCYFANNTNGIFVRSLRVIIQYCSIHNSTQLGLDIRSVLHHELRISEIMNSNFIGNSRALSLQFLSSNDQFKISDCLFKNQRISQLSKFKAAVKIEGNRNHTNAVSLENSQLISNQGFHGDCSALFLQDINIALSNVNVTENICTGIAVSGSQVKLVNTVNFSRNQGMHGGALSMNKASLVFTTSSRVFFINNTARIYGGGIYTNVACSSDRRKKCFFQLEGSPDSKILYFSGNNAEKGGDLVFGGCLQNCYITLKGHDTIINVDDPNNIFWDLVAAKNFLSPSTFVTYPKQVVFCANDSSSFSGNHTRVTCNFSFTVTAYRGQLFNVPLMVRDEFCYPLFEVIEAKAIENNQTLLLEGDKLQRGKKHCSNYSFAVIGDTKQKTANISFSFIQQQLFSNIPPVFLKVNLVDCPAGYEVNSRGSCDCHPILKAYKVKCNPHFYSLDIPGQTWVGDIEEWSGSLAVQKDCQFCKNEDMTIGNISDLESDRLCSANRRSVLCGACTEECSLKLGGYECADCSNSTHKGVLLLTAFAVIGIALVLLLLGLNLTVSTGMINGLIFYSNIVYLNSDTYLPITRDGNSNHLQNTVKILSTFQAWLNLDFGIVTCFFSGYDTYISTWMQFVFPLYIWLLIMTIVLASRYSSRISKITASNTVPVLATLLLLSFAKLLKTSIDAAAFTNVHLIHSSSKHHVWMLDGNIPYLQGKHIPLFLMSLFTLLVYILPFTLLILLGPLLHSKSHYKVLNWINKLKPFLDALYGPYTRRYRYWPGILLLARVVVLPTYTYYSPTDGPFKLMTVAVIVAVLLACWMLIGKTQNTSLHRKKRLNYLELFFLLNLETFTVASIYHSHITRNNTNQQRLAVAMVGSVLVAFCGILVSQIFWVLSRCRATRKIIQLIPKYNDKASQPSPSPESADIHTKTTYSVVEMKKSPTPTNELREPLLISS